MEKSKWSPYFWKIIWIVGLIIFAIESLNIENHFKQISNETISLIPVLWSNLIISIIFGIYVSLVFVKKWSFNINPSLLWCVTIPCIVISISYPLLVTLVPMFENLSFFVPYWLIRISTLEIFGVMAGLTLILSIFNTHSKNQ